MVDTRVEHGRGPGVWPWIAGLVVLALLVWGGMELLGGDPAREPATAPAPAPAAAGDPPRAART